MTEMTAKSIVESKLAFERLALINNVHIHHYHGANGLFDTKSFKSSVSSGHQTMTFCGANAHH